MYAAWDQAISLALLPAALERGRTMYRLHFSWNLLLLAVILPVQTGCLATPMSMLTQPRNTMETQVFLKPPFISHDRSRLLIYPFTHPMYAPRTGSIVTREFYQELMRSGLFRQIALSNQLQHDPGDLLVATELTDYDLALRGKIVHLLAGSGNTPSQLTVEIQIMTVSTGFLVWFVRLDATSETGADVDLVWHTYEGQGAQSYQVLARALAQQLVKVMTPPPEPPTQPLPVKSPLSPRPPENEN